MSGGLREPTVFILAALAGGRLHGYGIISAVEEMSEGRVRLSAGTLYGALDRLERDGYLEHAGEESAGGPRRRYYALSAKGRLLLQDEVARLTATAGQLQSALGQAWSS